MADIEEKRDLSILLCYTWKDCFVDDLHYLKATDIIEHKVTMMEGAKLWCKRHGFSGILRWK